MKGRSPRTPSRLRQAIHALGSEGAGRARDSWAIGLGLFIGCSPLIGFHLGLCLAAGWLFGLNRLKLYLAANLVNALVLPAVLFAEVQAGSLLRRGAVYPLSLSAFGALDPWLFGLDLALGTLVVGGAIGAVGGLLTFAVLGRSDRDPGFSALVKRAADRYLHAVMAWQFARGKLRHDPVYRAVVASGLLPQRGHLVDVGCGQGLLLALVAEARQAGLDGSWPAGWPPAPVELTLSGIELRQRVAAFAQDALGEAATIEAGDASQRAIGEADVVALFDVLHLIAEPGQESLVGRAAGALRPGGALLVREADAAGGWRFQAVRLGNRLTALVQRRPRSRLAFRTTAEWAAMLARHGLDVQVRQMSEGTPFANVLLVARRAGG
jgi:2-polyprenyl-3-methyl-5-hydroxy-6-metoxy-1,4-benzoquinol methylase